MNLQRILCFGDSNTWGSDPTHKKAGKRRLPFSNRWPGALANLLGIEYEIVENGLSGRTSCHDDPEEDGGKSGYQAISQLLELDNDFQLIIIMLGTNDMKAKFNQSAKDIRASIEQILSQIRNISQAEILLVAPICARQIKQYRDAFQGAAQKSQDLADELRQLADQLNIAFFDAGAVAQASDDDGIHMTADQHKKLATAMSLKIKE
ncbi:MAG: SGNH/GDSL hydrolase family protein [Lentilitoribacter sp.]